VIERSWVRLPAGALLDSDPGQVVGAGAGVE